MSDATSAPVLRAPRLALAVLLVGIWAAITIAGGLIQSGGSTGLDELVATGIVYGIPLAALSLLLPTLLGGWARVAGFTRPSGLRAARYPALIVVAMLVLATVAGLPPTATLAFLLCNSLFVGISEELAFRGVLLTPLVRRFGVRRAALYGAIAFGAVHSLNSIVTGEVAQALSQSFIAIGMGLWAGYLRLSTGSLYPPIILHAFWDFTLFAALAGGSQSEIALLALVALGGALGLGAWAYRSLGRLEQTAREIGATNDDSGYRVLDA